MPDDISLVIWSGGLIYLLEAIIAGVITHSQTCLIPYLAHVLTRSDRNLLLLKTEVCNNDVGGHDVLEQSATDVQSLQVRSGLKRRFVEVM